MNTLKDLLNCDMHPKPQTVTIPYDDFISLIRKERELDALMEAGIKNLEVYKRAMESLE